MAHTPNTADGRELSTHPQVRGPSSAAGQNLKYRKDSKHTANSKSGGNMQLTRLGGTTVSQAPTSTGRLGGEGRVACRQPMLAGQQPGSMQQRLTRILGILTRHASRPRAQHGDSGKALATQRARSLLSSRGTQHYAAGRSSTDSTEPDADKPLAARRLRAQGPSWQLEPTRTSGPGGLGQ